MARRGTRPSLTVLPGGLEPTTGGDGGLGPRLGSSDVDAQRLSEIDRALLRHPSARGRRPVGASVAPGVARPRCVAPPRVHPRPARSRALRRTPLALRYRVRRAVAVLVLGVCAAVVVVALGSLGEIARDAGPGIPTSTAQVVVQRGDTVWDIARRTVPDADPAVAAARIAELNGLHSAALRPGQILTVPRA